jgi:hypothetical protein
MLKYEPPIYIYVFLAVSFLLASPTKFCIVPFCSCTPEGSTGSRGDEGVYEKTGSKNFRNLEPTKGGAETCVYYECIHIHASVEFKLPKPSTLWNSPGRDKNCGSTLRKRALCTKNNP